MTMVNAKQDRRRRDIKSKLMAAIAMLLVSSIMMVSSTYAWFTLSTAPEVTGISTAVGANGNLEIALMNEEGNLNAIGSEVGDSVANQSINLANITWGNLVDVSTGYGLDKITLYPAALNGTDGIFNPTTPLKTPVYGVDGRVSELSANTLTSIFAENTFAGTAGYGVRAIGTSSSMSPQMKDFRAARAAGDTAMSAATTIATNSIKDNGSVLADIALAYGLNPESKFTKAQMESLLAVVTEMQAAVAEIDKAYFQYIYAAAIGGNTTAEQYQALTTALSSFKSAQELLDALSDANTANAPAGLQTALTALKTTSDQMVAAKGILQPLVDSGRTDDFTWTEFENAIRYLIKTDGVKVNGMSVSDIKNDIDAFSKKYFADGKVKMIISTGGGVYADVADHCANYDYGITISKISYRGFDLTDVPAHMYAESNLPTRYLTAVRSAIVTPVNTQNTNLTLTSFYGYILDLAFRTNASASNLMLQTDAVDRIYSDSQGVEGETYSTMGGGSNMTLMATTNDLSVDGIKELMGAIRVVFFAPPSGQETNNTILATATLDTANAELTADGWVADLIIVDEVTTTTYTEAADAATGTHYKVGDEYVAIADYVEDPDVTDNTSVTYTATTTTDVTKTDGTITSLEPNTPTAISVLVYLDGNNITNKSVAASAANSLEGKLNLQFSSSATLVPMEYADLMGDSISGGDDTQG